MVNASSGLPATSVHGSARVAPRGPLHRFGAHAENDRITARRGERVRITEVLPETPTSRRCSVSLRGECGPSVAVEINHTKSKRPRVYTRGPPELPRWNGRNF